jgi:hypothetical protein
VRGAAHDHLQPPGLLEPAREPVDASVVEPIAVDCEGHQILLKACPIRRRVVAVARAPRDPTRFEPLYAALPAQMCAAGARLSPLASANRLRAPVELVTAPHDKYFPPAESHALAEAAPTVHVTVTAALAHADPRIALRDPPGLSQFCTFGARALQVLAA